MVSRTKTLVPEAPETSRDEHVLLEIRDLALQFDTYVGSVRALEGVNLVIRRNETLGLVGESGCGKSVTAMSVMRLVPTPPGRYRRGRIIFRPTPDVEMDLLDLSEEDMQQVRGNDISVIFQEPMTSLNPVMSVGNQIGEAILRHQALGLEPPSALERALESRGRFWTPRSRERRRRARALAAETLRRIGIADSEVLAERYPHELSGGMRQRVMIAMALACKPWLLIADEPTTALDVTIQAQIMDLMKELKREEDSSILLITHHLGIVAEMCDRVAVMYAGQVAETAPTKEIFDAPKHPYTVGLLKSIPSLRGERKDIPVIPGRVPNLIDPPSGCRYRPRCAFAVAKCATERPPSIRVGDDHEVACHLYDGEHEVPRELADAGGASRKEVES